MSKRNFPKTARGVATEALCRVEEDSAYSSFALDSLLEKNDMTNQDKALATRLFYGTLQKRIFLDYQLEAVSGRKMLRLDPPVASSLRLGAYQIYFCDKIPKSAAVNEAVNTVKKSGFTSAAGLVNAVLRKLDSGNIVYPKNEAERISVEHSLPLWLVRLFKTSYPTENLAEMAAAFDSEPDIFVRINTTLTNRDELTRILAGEGITAEKTAVENSLKILGAGDIKSSMAFKKGLFHVQDLSSQLCAKALNPNRGDKILDICSAPGGKSFTVAELAQNDCSLISCDLHENRTEIIKSGASRLHLTCITALTSDARIYNPELGEFDRVLCDAPCSGLGVIRRKPEIRFKPESELEKYGELQAEILLNASRYVKKGGRLIYSTCTLNPKENTEVVNAFLVSSRDFELTPLFEGSSEACKTFFPHKDGTDGFFVAAFKRKGES